MYCIGFPPIGDVSRSCVLLEVGAVYKVEQQVDRCGSKAGHPGVWGVHRVMPLMCGEGCRLGLLSVRLKEVSHMLDSVFLDGLEPTPC